MAWLGRKKLAFIPLSRTNIQPPDVIPPDWSGQIMQRLFFDPATDPTTGDPIPGADRSVRAYFHTVSSGLADLDVVVLPAQTIAEENVPPDALEATMGTQLRSEGFVGAAIVMLGGPGGGSTSPVSNFAWSRILHVPMISVPGWARSCTKLTCAIFPTCLISLGSIHPARTWVPSTRRLAIKPLISRLGRSGPSDGWILRPLRRTQGGVAEYNLHSVSLIQPPPTGRIAAVQIGAAVPYLMVEARLQADQFDINIPNEGVIVYRVQTTDPLGHAQPGTAPLALLTKTALTAGQSFTTDGVTIYVGDAVLGGGFSIQVETIETGQLLSYGDAGTPGNVSDPVVVGFGGWLDFKFLFGGENLSGENRIYAVNQNGQLLSYGDDGTPGNVSDPVVVGFGGWLDFKFLFGGENLSGENRIYAVNQNGQLLSYGDDRNSRQCLRPSGRRLRRVAGLQVSVRR